MIVRYTLDARQHLAGIHAYIALHDSTAALRVLRRIHSVINTLAEFPRLGHIGIIRGTRELAVRGLPYIVVYEARAKARVIVILGIFHGAQER